MTSISLLPEVQQFLERAKSSFIEGKYVAQRGETLELINPANAQPLSELRCADDDVVQASVDSAQHGFEIWSAMLPAEREIRLLKLAEVVARHRDELAQIETLQSGKLLTLSRNFEIDQVVHFLRYYAGWATKIGGETIKPSLPSQDGEGYFAWTLRQPVGVVVGIVPWNFATMIGIWKIASALVTGCSIIVKPSEFTPLTALRLAELALEADIPPGVLNVVVGKGDVGGKLIAHPGTHKVSFTGSIPTGSKVGQSAMAAKLTRATLELGGKNAVGFLSDIDLDKAARGVMEAGFLHSGQVCAAGERFYVPRKLMSPLLDRVKQHLAALRIGDPLDEATQFGPVTNRPHLEKLRHYFQIAQKENNEVIFGGHVIDRPGFFVEPTLVVANSINDTLLNEETFGPIATFFPYDDEDELLALMNHSDFGLSASLWSNDMSKLMRLIPKVEAGTVWVNMHTLLDPAVPFGGVKSSGIGREFGAAFIDDYTELKSVMMRY